VKELKAYSDKLMQQTPHPAFCHLLYIGCREWNQGGMRDPSTMPSKENYETNEQTHSTIAVIQ
jgi:hypothetical protein